METDPFWTHVHALLDARKDPLRDAVVREHLAEHPDDFAALERITRPLDLLASTSVAPLEPRPWGHVAPLLALTGLAAALVLFLRAHEPASPPPVPDAMTHDVADRCVIFDYRVELVIEDGASRTHRILTPAGESLRIDRRDAREGVFSYAVALAPEAHR